MVSLIKAVMNSQFSFESLLERMNILLVKDGIHSGMKRFL